MGIMFLSWRGFLHAPSKPKGPRKELTTCVSANSEVATSYLDQAAQPGLDDISSIDEALLQAQQHVANATQCHQARVSRPWQDGELRGVFQQAWAHLTQARSRKKKSLRNVFQAWRHIRRFSVLIKSTRKRCRRLRRLQLLGVLNYARSGPQSQYNGGNITGVFKLVDRLAPKRSKGKPQMRSAEGVLLDTVQEAEAAAQYLRQLYHD